MLPPDKFYLMPFSFYHMRIREGWRLAKWDRAAYLHVKFELFYRLYMDVMQKRMNNKLLCES